MGLVLSGLMLPMAASAQEVIPAKRFVLSEDADLPGGDVATQFDTTLEACERACLAHQSCTHFTFNTRNGSCFLKADPGEEAFYQGALSGRLVANDAKVVANAPARKAELTFLSEDDFSRALTLAQGLANDHTSGQWSAEDHMASAQEMEAQGNALEAANYAGAAVNVTDKPELWVEYSRLSLQQAQANQGDTGQAQDRALLAAINAYLRSPNKALRHTSLVVMAQALEQIGRGSDMVKALRLAQDTQPRDDTAALLEDAAGKYGFRVLETDVQSDNARPRICVNLSENLVEAGLDYAPFVQLPEPGLTVQPGGWRQLCVEGAAWQTLSADLP
ncbi:PAN/Apple domain-containing protein [Gemmobacter lanyuensis]